MTAHQCPIQNVISKSFSREDNGVRDSKRKSKERASDLLGVWSEKSGLTYSWCGKSISAGNDKHFQYASKAGVELTEEVNKNEAVLTKSLFRKTHVLGGR
jgi:hypothetical protein